MTVVVVTDSSARLPADLLDKWGIRVVPLHILLDGTDLRDGVDDIPGDIHKLAATWYEKSDISSTDMHPYVHAFSVP
ncbi:DegV family protein, partial [Mycobacterium intracellulare]|uniref:DegV family protein n=1 Tax=Mycobacterium intracellulare TaxID=1767 RepID=UPI000ACF13BF